MKLKINENGKEKEININFWSFFKIYIICYAVMYLATALGAVFLAFSLV